MAAFAGISVVTLFAPFDDTEGEFLKFVSRAKKSLVIVIYGFHLPKLTDILIAKHQARVKVAVILDHTQAEGKAESSEVQKLVDAGVPLLIGTSPVHRAILHSKFCVTDSKAVEFGSWNYSLSASQQSNTMTYIEDRNYARVFTQHFDRIRDFITLHEMAMQPAHEVIPDPAA
jgi:phosphatidylserine/phosphatidylglycerophosphate/cardiolipin synthase-like enzyme